jgi:hypothetical protein
MSTPSTTIAGIIDRISYEIEDLPHLTSEEQYKRAALDLLRAQSVIPADQVYSALGTYLKRYPYDKYVNYTLHEEEYMNNRSPFRRPYNEWASSMISQHMRRKPVVDEDLEDKEYEDDEPAESPRELKKPEMPDFSWTSSFDVKEIQQAIDSIVEYLGSTEDEEQVSVLRNDIRVLDNLASALRKGDPEKISKCWEIACSEGSCEHLHKEFVGKMTECTKNKSVRYESLGAFVGEPEEQVVFKEQAEWKERCAKLGLSVKEGSTFASAYTKGGDLAGSYNTVSNSGWVYMEEGWGEPNPGVVHAITRRIMNQRVDLLAKYGPEMVGQAIDEVADYVGDVDEIGSSDVSGWVRHVEQMLSNMEPTTENLEELGRGTLQRYADAAKRDYNDTNKWARDEGMGSYRDRLKGDEDPYWDNSDHWSTLQQTRRVNGLKRAKARGVVPTKPGAGRHTRAGDQLRSDSRGTMGGSGMREGNGFDRFARKYVPGAANRQVRSKIDDEKFSQIISQDGMNTGNPEVDAQNTREYRQTTRNIDRLNRFRKAKGMHEGKADNIAKLKRDLKDAEYWAANAKSDRERRQHLHKVTKIKQHLKSQYQISESAPPGEENWIEANKDNFIKQYGEKKGMEVLYGKAWQRYNAKHNQMQESRSKRGDWEYERDRQDGIDNPDRFAGLERYQPTAQEIEAERRRQQQKQHELKRTMGFLNGGGK